MGADVTGRVAEAGARVRAMKPASGKPRTMFEKIWEAHLVRAQTPDTPAILYVDLHLVHEVTSPQAFTWLRERGLKVRRPERTVATMDHSTPTTPRGRDGRIPVLDNAAAMQIAALEKNCAGLRHRAARAGQRGPGDRARHRAGAGADPAGRR